MRDTIWKGGAEDGETALTACTRDAKWKYVGCGRRHDRAVSYSRLYYVGNIKTKKGRQNNQEKKRKNSEKESEHSNESLQGRYTR